MPALDRNSPVALYHQLEQALKDHIRAELAIGDKLPSIRTLLKEYAVSLPVVRQALNNLETEGVITIHQGKGCLVNIIPPERTELSRRIFVVMNATGFRANFYFKVLLGIQQHAGAIPVEILDVENFPHHVFQQAYHGQYGVVVCGSLTPAITKTLNNMDHPCLVIGDGDETSDTLKQPNRIVNDDESGGWLAAKHLSEQPCTEYLIVARNPKQPYAQQRIKGYRRALKEIGAKATVLACGEHAAKSIAAHISTMGAWDDPARCLGILAATDRIAMGAMEAAKEHGLSVPGQVRVTGFDNDYFSQELIPPLTTVAINVQEMGRTCMRLIHEAWSGQTIPPKTIVPVSLVARESA